MRLVVMEILDFLEWFWVCCVVVLFVVILLVKEQFLVLEIFVMRDVSEVLFELMSVGVEFIFLFGGFFELGVLCI